MKKYRINRGIYKGTEDSVKLWERDKETLMKLSKEDLVELIIGRKRGF